MLQERRRMTARRILPALLAALLLIGGMLTVSAAGEAETSKTIARGETHEGDYFTSALYLTVEGGVKGDLLTAAQNLNMSGEIAGDILGFAQQLDLTGTVDGNVRMVTNTTATLSGYIARNLMIYGTSVHATDDSKVGGSAYVFGAIVELDGVVEGDTMIGADNVSLGGTFNGDVSINSNMGEMYGTPVSSLTLKPGTVITGTLTVRAENEPVIPEGVTVGKLNFTPYVKNQTQAATGTSSFIRSILTALVFFLFALVLLRIFPKFFVRPADYLRHSLMKTAGIGMAALGSMVAGSIVVVILVVLGIVLLNFSVAGFALTVFTAFVVVLSSLSTLPVSLWLGRLLLGGHKSVPVSLAAGLAVITLTRILLDFAVTMPGIGGILGVVNWVMNLAIWLLGMGSLLRTLRDFVQSANRDAAIADAAVASAGPADIDLLGK